MVDPIRPDPAARFSRLIVADVVLVFEDDFKPGDDYLVDLVLSRSLDAYERYAVLESHPFGLWVYEPDRLRTRTEIEDLDPHQILDALEGIVGLAASRRDDARVEQQHLRAHAQRVKSVLRPTP